MNGRRMHFGLATLALLMLTLSIFAATTGSAMASDPQILPLWQGEAPGGGGPSGSAKETAWGSVKQISTPDMRVFLPAKPNGAAVLVIAGGGYKQISRKGEGYAAADWLNARGYAAFVLTYRLPGDGWNAGPAAPLQDAERAIRLIRQDASRYGIDRNRVGVLGFSAGGNLAGLLAVRSAFNAYPPVDAADKLSTRPDWAALIYPVISMRAPFDHTSSFHQMIGAHPTPDLIADWSVETHVDGKTPPVFLTHAADDPIVDIRQSELMVATCERAKVPVTYLRLSTGGHGFALGRKGTDSMGWTVAFEKWLKRFDVTAVSSVAPAPAAKIADEQKPKPL